VFVCCYVIGSLIADKYKRLQQQRSPIQTTTTAYNRQKPAQEGRGGPRIITYRHSTSYGDRAVNPTKEDTTAYPRGGFPVSGSRVDEL
jgi:hypothetical protein